ncbi:MAG: NAD-dependent deacylase [Chloroflexi bacterium]|nr:NAD-dependent deacylase [Chloroflexota bacterium]
MGQLLQAALDILRGAEYLVALTGAGISTHSGIPDFRSPHCGLWERDNPAEVASLYGFRYYPERFYNWMRPLAHQILDAIPNPAHEALAHLESQGRLKSVITQNIDMLHASAGSQTVYELHGHLREVTCIHCFQTYPAEAVLLEYLETNKLPLCSACGHVLKPNVILVGEQLPAQALTAARREAQRCDAMLIIGSSLEAYPAAQLPLIARQNDAALIIVNLTATPIDTHAQVVIHDDAVLVLPQLVAALENE